MIGFIKEWVLNIVTLVLFIVIIETLVPSGRMRKYASLVTGFILIMAIINPFLKPLGSKIDLTDIQIHNSSYIDKLEIEKDGKLLKKQQMKQIVEIYRKKIVGQLEQGAKNTKGVTGAKADVIINEDYNSANFGEIKRAYLEVCVEEKDEEIKPVAEIEKIKIIAQDSTTESTSNNTSANNQGKIDPSIKKLLEDRLASIFNIDRNNIVISMLRD